MLVIEPTKGRELTHWAQIHWTAVKANVRRLQGRIYRAAANNEPSKVTHLLALEPEWESRFEANSYGFRPGRSTMDAITAIHTVMSRKNGSQWVLDADIKGCLDHTS